MRKIPEEIYIVELTPEGRDKYGRVARPPEKGFIRLCYRKSDVSNIIGSNPGTKAKVYKSKIVLEEIPWPF